MLQAMSTRIVTKYSKSRRRAADWRQPCRARLVTNPGVADELYKCRKRMPVREPKIYIFRYGGSC